MLYKNEKLDYDNTEMFEKKTFPFDVKKLDENGIFEGYAAIFGKPDAMGETIEKGAFEKTLKEKDFFPMCWYHNPTDPIGIAYLMEDAKGLKLKGELNLNVQSAREKYELMKQKAIRGLSFGFKTIKDIWQGPNRFIKEVKLYEVSPCTFQAHPQALISAVKQYPSEHSARINGAIEFLKELKSGKMISAANLKLINNAVEALVVILKKLEPSEDTQAGKKGIFSSVIEGLETENKPQEHLFESTIKTLGNIKQEE